ncbi:hypothetical protein D3C72_2050690 [compost metagenome]
MHLVAGADNLALAVDRIDRIVITRRAPRARIFGANGTGDQHLTILQNIGNACQCVLVLGENKRQGCFRPDDHIRPLGAFGGRSRAQRQMFLEDRHAVAIVHFSSLIDDRLNEAY